MKLKYTGELDRVTVRGVDFPRNKPVTIDCENLAEKMLAWPDVVEVKRGAKADGKNAS
ncbi:hypothetical protein PhaeoP48_01208 [Phaeobacter inhibens]|uniref:hypothetical protein n=1 Tax=Phaeobacter inhibens TaxID=221822 RepID=UPI000CA0A3BD|nr:hypothetical protein [Phaeobacter inhibens]AUR11205.1 hypothetical protein PhaeoP48_01208 [Phaeobacter inhibens]